jgi:phosphatidylglycerophosphatase A
MNRRMKKCWYIDILGRKEGPYTPLELRGDRRINPDTLVWKEGFKNWVPIKNVPELKIVFQDEVLSTDEEDPQVEERKKLAKLVKDEVIAVDLQNKFPHFMFWILIFLVLMTFFLYRIYRPY